MLDWKTSETAFLELFKDNNGKLSFCRVFSAIFMFCDIGWITTVVVFTHAIPDLTSHSLVFTALYGFNQLSNIPNKNN